MAIDEANAAKKLLEAVDEIDRQLKEKQLILTQNNVDMDTPLVDSEGFPSDTIDVISVRQARHDIICLQNDRKKLMDQISEAIAQLHQQQAATSSGKTENSEAGNGETVHRTSNDPFLVIKSVEGNSPAFAANFKPNDLIIQFGDLHAGNYVGFQQLKDLVQNSIDKTIKVTIFRENIDGSDSCHVHRLELRPKQWAGDGFLGCTFGTIQKK